MAYTKGIKANQIKKVLGWLKEGETPARIAKFLDCDVACIESFVGKGKEVIPDSVPRVEAKAAVVAEAEATEAAEVKNPVPRRAKKS